MGSALMSALITILSLTVALWVQGDIKYMAVFMAGMWSMETIYHLAKFCKGDLTK